MGGGCELGLKVENHCQSTHAAHLAEWCLRHFGASGKVYEARGNTDPTVEPEWIKKGKNNGRYY